MACECWAASLSARYRQRAATVPQAVSAQKIRRHMAGKHRRIWAAETWLRSGRTTCGHGVLLQLQTVSFPSPLLCIRLLSGRWTVSQTIVLMESPLDLSISVRTIFTACQPPPLQ